MPGLDAIAWRQQCEVLRGLAFSEDRNRFGESIIADLRTRKRRGAHSFETMYRDTLKDLRTSERTDLLRQFCESSWFSSYGEACDRRSQICFEEATYRFLSERGVGDEEVRRVEFLHAITRALAVQPSCAFSVPAEVRAAPFGCFALAPLAGKTLLFAIVEGRLVTGPVSPASAAFLRASGRRPATWSLAQEDWHTIGRALAAIGIVF